MFWLLRCVRFVLFCFFSVFFLSLLLLLVFWHGAAALFLPVRILPDCPMSRASPSESSSWLTLCLCFSFFHFWQVWIRGATWIRGFCVGYIAAFDKQWNLAMTDVDETFTRRRHRKTPILGTVFSSQCSTLQRSRDSAFLIRSDAADGRDLATVPSLLFTSPLADRNTSRPSISNLSPSLYVTHLLSREI